jgi:hypothetical protein
LGQVGNDSKGHAIFSDMKFGYYAFANDILYKIFQRPNKLNTIGVIGKIVNVYAPASDGNNVEKYIKYLEQKTGINRNAILTKNKAVLIRLLDAMGEYEVGANYYKLIPQTDKNFGIEKAFKKYAIDAGSAASSATNNTGKVFLTLTILGIVFYVVKK